MSLGDTTVAGIVFEVAMRTEVRVEHIEVAGLLDAVPAKAKGRG